MGRESQRENPYDVLGLPRGASEAEVKKQAKKLALKYHPDKHPDNPESHAEMMKIINQARDEILNPSGQGVSFAPAPTDAFGSVDEEPLISPIAIRIEGPDTPSVLFSQVCQERHASLVSEYTEHPSLSCSVPYLKSVGLDSSSSVPVWRQSEKAKSKGKEPLKSPFQTLNPAVAINIFIRFLKGEYDDDEVIHIKNKLSFEIRKIRESRQYSFEIFLYEGIFEIMCLATAGHEKNLIFAIRKIIDCAVNMPSAPIILLFQNRHFRDLFSQAIHFYWQSDTSILSPECFRKLSDQERTGLYLREFRADLVKEEKELQEREAEEVSLAEQEEERQAEQAERKKKIEKLEKVVRRFHALCQFETYLNVTDDFEHSAEANRERAYYILNWSEALYGCGIPLRMIFIQAGMYFQRASLLESRPAIRMADERLAFEMYATAFCGEKGTPDEKLDAYIQGFRYIALFQFQHPKIAEGVKLFQRRMLKIADIFPFFEQERSHVDFLVQSNKGLLFLRTFLHRLVDIIERNKLTRLRELPQTGRTIDHRPAKILGFIYKSFLRDRGRWYEKTYNPETEAVIRILLMETLLSEHDWHFGDLGRNTRSSMTQRDTYGWIQPTRSLSFPAGVKRYRSIDGVKINFQTGALDFSLTPCDLSSSLKNPKNTIAKGDGTDLLVKM